MKLAIRYDRVGSDRPNRGWRGCPPVVSSTDARARVIDVHAHVIVPEVYAVAAEHNVFSELPTDPGVTDEMRGRSRTAPQAVLGRMSDVGDRIAKMDAMGVDVQVLSASLVHQGLEWADAQTSLRLARTTNDWIAKAVAGNPARFIGLGTLPLHVPALAVAELERCLRELGLGGVAISTTAAAMELGDAALQPFWAKAEELEARWSTSIPAAIATAASSAFTSGTASARRSRRRWRSRRLMYDGVLETFPRLQDLHLAWRRLHAVLYGPHRPQLRRESQHPRQHDEAADRLSAHALFRLLRL